MRLTFRGGVPTDHAYVYDSFVATYRGTPHARGASVATLVSLMEPLLAPGSEWRLLVACDPDDEDCIVGFVVSRQRAQRLPQVAWLQVRSEWKRRGVGRALLSAAGVPSGQTVELDVPFIVQRIGRDRDMPTLVELARAHGMTLRFRPYLPLEAARHALMSDGHA